ncbi:uncharacterized protein LOC128896042 [Hylaeus anthracinus]|uniref:uncharacterized protein LOC128896042 n=1 Tax=Hylaeus anthracinus TaxID=313031 RepID=UPI0023BA17BE|nr:uncharacterized protein LOC128896042 [Hylaeus anthracinus]
MTKIILSLFLIICAVSIIFALDDKSYCFSFTWQNQVALPNNSTSDDTKCNHTIYKNVPCIDPLIISDDAPNTTKIWEEQDKSMLCASGPGNVCIKYTYVYNNAIKNTSLFCGKVVEDQVTPLTSGCYEQKVAGYTIETCACKPKKNSEPCNGSIRTNYSIIITIISLVFVFMKSSY